MNINTFEKYNDYFKFVFVRHPYEWIKSYYNFHYNKKKFYKQICDKNVNNTITVSFDEWLNTLTEFNQSDFFTKGDKILVDKICKLENFDNEMVFLLKKFNIDTIKELTDEQKIKIQKICKKDFELLEY
jgi:hypothetical protein